MHRTESPPARDHRGPDSLRGDWELLLSVTTSLQQERSLEDRLDEICAQVCQTLGFEKAAIFLVAGEGDRLALHGSYGLSPTYIRGINQQRIISIKGSDRDSWAPTARAFYEQRPVIIDDLWSDPTTTPWQELTRGEGLRSILSIPLVVHGRSVGVLNCYGTKAGCFRGKGVRLLSVIASFIALTTELAELYATLAKQYELLERSKRIHQTLTRLVLADDGLSSIATTVGELLQGEVIILSPAFDVHVATIDVPEALLNFLRQRLSGSEAGGASEPIPLPPTLAAGTRWRRGQPEQAGPGGADVLCALCVPITAGGGSFGHLVVVKPAGAVEPLDGQAIEQAATLVALEFSKLHKAEEAELRLKGHFLYELLSEHPPNAAYLKRRARQIGYPVDGPYQLLLAALWDKEGNPIEEWSMTALTTVKRRLEGWGNAVLFGEKQGQAVFVYSLQPHQRGKSRELGRTVGKYVLEVLSSAKPEARCQVVTGGAVDCLTEIHQSYQQARKALGVISRLKQENAVISHDELGIYRFIMDTRSPDELVAFVHQVLGPLLRYDDQKKLGLMKTLDAFLSENLSIDRTARAMHLHPNTVRYRLQRVAELSGLDPFRTEDLLVLQLAVSVWRLMGVDGLTRRNVVP